jgi:hypothetical protein
MAYIRSANPEWHTLAIANCTVDDLRQLLDPVVPIVHVWYHHPFSNSAWVDEWLPLCKGGPRQPLRVRNLQFDFEMPTAAFLADLHRVRRASSGGINLIHVDRSLPPNVVPWHSRGSDDANRLFDRLFTNGMQARFTLPHGGEVGMFASRSRQNLERALHVDELRARCIEHDPA